MRVPRSFGVRRSASLAVVAFCLGALSSGPSAAADWRAKVDPALLAQVENGSGPERQEQPGRQGIALGSEFIVFLDSQADLAPASKIASRSERGAFVMARLQGLAQSTQAPLLNELERQGAEYRAFWIANMIWVRGDARTVETMALRAEVARVAANPYVAMDEPLATEPGAGSRPLAGIEASLSHVGAPDVWALGYTGQNVVVASADTGVQWDHPALKNQYRGWDGALADHDYNWHDAIHSGGGSCGADSPLPCDDVYHGTHTVGTMLGDDGGSNQIGMAPGANWIACRNMDGGVGSPTTYAECFQWFVAPTDPNDLNPDPSLAPHIINNSWSCPVSEGCNDPLILETVVENTRAAGISVVVSAGNSGSGCSTVNTPTAIYDASYTVAATQLNDGIASFSSRGPVSVDGSNRLKPNVAAPGVSIRSSQPGNGYRYASGTSMAAPHVTGLMALLISANPALGGQPGVLESLINGYAVPLTTSQGCGGDAPDDVPNNVYGHGRIDSLASVNAALAWALPGLSLYGAALAVLCLGWLGRRAARHPSQGWGAERH